MPYVIAFVMGLVGGVVGGTIRKQVERRLEWKRGAKMRAANRRTIDEEIARTWVQPVQVDAFTQHRRGLPMSSLELARMVGPKGAAGDSGAARR